MGPGSLVCPRARRPGGTRAVSGMELRRRAAEWESGRADLALGVRPLRGAQVQVSP